MAASGVRKTLLQFSSASAKTLVNRSTTTSNTSTFTVKTAKLNGLFPSKPTSASPSSLGRLGFSRIPTELGGVLSLIPLHSVTASALSTSLLSLHGDSQHHYNKGFELLSDYWQEMYCGLVLI
ncbi:hypothetical protein Tsubulata_026952 [Turnera subulata]|uniref:Uncharacterized protein n=1 Tax=Turnera subulata TaxID=218843 RepID=A0A9Q0F2B5_9ROSI|nr:hypothetical protein Tsubulata_026952 [Turnera subulata]